MRNITETAIRVGRGGDGEAIVHLSGDWTLYDDRPTFHDVLEKEEMLAGARAVRIDAGDVSRWDSQLLVFLLSARNHCARREITFATGRLPVGLERLLNQVPQEAGDIKIPQKPSFAFLPWAAGRAGTLGERVIEVLQFTGEIARGVVRILRRPKHFRWRDCLEAMHQCGAMALPIVGLISFLVGVIMAFQGVIQLRRFGADIFVADLVGLAVVREMGPMMAAVVLAGRTGAAFAAQIGTMKVNEEIDALQTLGVSPVDFLVMPRMLALFLMMPLLAIYANFLGIIGGLFVSINIMDLTAGTYLMRTREAIMMTDIYSGLVKSVAFGLLIAFSGCLRGLQCKRNSAGVGAAATSAVVTSIFLMIVANALFAFIFNRLGI